MGQVPSVNSGASNHILLIGDGRVGRTLLHLLSSRKNTSTSAKACDWRSWSRRSKVTLPELLAVFPATHVWLAISDRALKGFVEQNKIALGARGPIITHFAGSMGTFTVENLTVHAAHPLTTLTGATDSATLDGFAKTPFILDRGGPDLATLMPGFTNPVHRIDSHARAYYHSLCAMAGNFSVLLWETVANRFESELALPVSDDVLAAYREQIFRNLNRLRPSKEASVITGPLVRNDTATLDAHHAALADRDEMILLKIYDAFTLLYRNSSLKTERTEYENHS